MLTIERPLGSQYAEVTDLSCFHSARKVAVPALDALNSSTLPSSSSSTPFCACQNRGEPTFSIDYSSVNRTHWEFLQLPHVPDPARENKPSGTGMREEEDSGSLERSIVRCCEEERRVRRIHAHTADLLFRNLIRSSFRFVLAQVKMCEPSLGVRQPHLMARRWEVHACDQHFVHGKNLARDTRGEGQRANGRVVCTRIYLESWR